MVRTILILATVSFTSHAFADGDLQREAAAVPQATANVEGNEAIVSEQSLATHMGWSDQQAVFRAPRNFRQNVLNEIGPDSLEAAPDDSSAN